MVFVNASLKKVATDKIYDSSQGYDNLIIKEFRKLPQKAIQLYTEITFNLLKGLGTSFSQKKLRYSQEKTKTLNFVSTLS